MWDMMIGHPVKNESHATEDAKVHVLGDLDWGMCLIRRLQPHPAPLFSESLDTKLVVDAGDDDILVDALNVAVESDVATVGDAGVDHGVAFHARVVGVKGVENQVAVKINPSLDVIRRRGREARGRAH
jgi:hypothetical protein